jgi:hypothetical protein
MENLGYGTRDTGRVTGKCYRLKVKTDSALVVGFSPLPGERGQGVRPNSQILVKHEYRSKGTRNWVRG